MDAIVDSTVEINSSVANGPTLANDDFCGTSIANIGDLNNGGTNDIAVGAYLDDEGGIDRGAVHIHFMSDVQLPTISEITPISTPTK